MTEPIDGPGHLLQTKLIEKLDVVAYLMGHGRCKAMHHGDELVPSTWLPGQEAADCWSEEGIGPTVGVAEVSLRVHELQERSISGKDRNQLLLLLLCSAGRDWLLGGGSTAISAPPLGGTPPTTHVTHLRVIRREHSRDGVFGKLNSPITLSELSATETGL